MTEAGGSSVSEESGFGADSKGWNALVRKITTPGDLATVLIAAPVGFVADVALSLTGLISPGVVGLLAASTALGAKKGIEATVQHSKGRDRASVPIKEKATAAIDLLRENELEIEADAIVRELKLYESGLSSEKQLDDVIDKGISAYRKKHHPTNVSPAKKPK